jgi:hypothetical protein
MDFFKKLVKVLSVLIHKNQFITFWIFFILLVILIIKIEPWNAKAKLDLVIDTYNKTEDYQKTNRDTFREEVFEYDKTLLNWILEHIFKDDYKKYKNTEVDELEIWVKKMVMSADWTAREYDWILNAWEQLTTTPVEIKDFFTEDNFNSFFQAIWFQWNKFNTIYDEAIFKDSELIKTYAWVIENINKMYKWYIVTNNENNSHYIFLMIKTPWELLDEWLRKEDLYEQIKQLNNLFYTKIWTLISDKYKEISSLAQYDVWMLQLIKYQDNFNKIIEERKSSYKNWEHDLMIFNFFWEYNDFTQYANIYLWTETFVNDILFKKIIWIL